MRRRPMLLAFAFGASAAAASACSLLVDTGGLSSGATTPDAGQGPTPDCGASACLDDGATPQADASLDVAMSPDSSTACSRLGVHTFCEDFDTTAPLSSRWLVDQSAGSVTVAPGLNRSPPSSLLVTAGPNAPSESRAGVGLLLPPSQHVVLEYSLAVEAIDPSGNLEVGSLVHYPLPSGFTDFTFAIFITNQQIRLWEHTNTPSGFDTTLMPMWPIGELHRIRMDLQIGSPASITVSVDGAIKLQRAVQGATSQGVGMGVGATSVVSGTGAWKVRVDDVTVDLE